METRFKKIVILIAAIFVFWPGFSFADYIGEQEQFFIDSSYDLFEREEVSATLKKISSRLYLYLEDEWWQALSAESQIKVLQSLKFLDDEFTENIYPVLTSTFGQEAKPGIDKDEKITVLVFPMKEEAGGYFNDGDGYPKIQFPQSNEREIIYLNSQHINSAKAKGFLAHEFMHLITLNQKRKKLGIEEEIWLNEARSEYAPTLLGYDDNFSGSNLQSRVETFLKWPDDSLVEWQGKIADYGALNIFTQYVVDQYGKEVLVDSLHFPNLGIPSLDYALKQRGYKEDFSQVFIDWTITIFLNDCSIKRPDGTEGKYCFKNPNLKNTRVNPSLTFLPFSKESGLSLVEFTKNWAGNWYKVIGGKGRLEFKFDGADEANFVLPVITQDLQGNYTIDYLKLDETQKGLFKIGNFEEKFASIIIIPQIHSKRIGFSGIEPAFAYSWKVSTIEETGDSSAVNGTSTQEEPANQMTVEELKVKISEILSLIEELKAKINKAKSEILFSQIPAGFKFQNPISQGETLSEVRYLQIVLNSDPETRLAEEGIGSLGKETDYFGPLTQNALIRFQEKYTDDILLPLGLNKGTGFFGYFTIKKTNSLIEK